EIEPHVSCLAGLAVKSTGITDYRLVCLEYMKQIERAGGTVAMNAEVTGIRDLEQSRVIQTRAGQEYQAKFVVNCAGLHSDRVARVAGTDPKAKIVPFRGEYYQLVPEKRHL